MARQLEVGMVWINDLVQSQHDVPWGGYKDSGYGRECFSDGTIGMANRKSIVIET